MQRWCWLTVAALASLTVVSCGDDGGCPSGFTDCGGFCFNLDIDPTNCGACGNACDTGEVCGVAAGEEETTCIADCPDGQVVCGNQCVTLDSSRENCGACGTECGAGLVCSGGACAATCGGGTTVCGDECRDLQVDPNNCGACGTACAANEVCSGGTCAFDCGGGLTQCGGTCTDTSRDRANCGGCGTACSSTELCVDGACELTCAAGLTECDGACVDTSSNAANCGGCGTACETGQVCRLGSCSTECGGATPDLCTVTVEGATVESCVDFDSNPFFCGDCETACEEGEVCSGGVCGVVCDTGLTDCDGACVDLATNANNCGACGDACPAVPGGTALCAESQCGGLCDEGFFDCNLDAGRADSDGCEAELALDIDNCGACGVSCDVDNAAGTCSEGACEIVACDAGFADCDTMVSTGCEAETDTDPMNCGACGTVCGMGEICAAGDCLDETQTGADCSTAIPLDVGTFTYSWFDTSDRTDAFGNPAGCTTTADAGPDIVFSYTPTTTVDATVSTTPPSSTRWDMAVAAGTCGDLSGQLACSSQFGSTMTMTFRARAGTTYFIYLRDTTSGSNPLDNPVSMTLSEVAAPPVPAGCDLGDPGVVAGTITKRRTSLAGFSFTEYEMFNVSGGATSGELLIGSTFNTFALNKATDVARDIERIVPLLSVEQGYTLAAVGNDWFTIDDTTGTNRVYRISSDGGVTFFPVPEVVGTEPSSGDDDIRGSAVDGTTLYLLTEEDTDTLTTEIYALDTTAPYPQVMTEQTFTGEEDCNALALDANNFYLMCEDRDRIVRVDRTTLAVTLITDSIINLSLTKNNIVAADTSTPPDGSADILYINDSLGTIRYICNPTSATPFVGIVGRVTSGTSSNYGLAYDAASNTLFAWDDDTRELVVIQ
ncbi:MAG: MXAN_6577-like cysteine-rich protein [Myxococcota bacterium]